LKEKNILRISKDKENPYVMINKNVMQDERLSWKARGLMGYLLSLPDDWVIYLQELEKRSGKDGRESLASGIKELIDLGYITREAVRSNKGTFSAWNYTVYECPQLGIVTENGKADNGQLTINGLSVNGLANSGKPATTNTHCTNKDLTKRKYKKKKPSQERTASNKYDAFYL